jgi:hypothetical protein
MRRRRRRGPQRRSATSYSRYSAGRALAQNRIARSRARCARPHMTLGAPATRSGCGRWRRIRHGLVVSVPWCSKQTSLLHCLHACIVSLASPWMPGVGPGGRRPPLNASCAQSIPQLLSVSAGCELIPENFPRLSNPHKSGLRALALAAGGGCPGGARRVRPEAAGQPGARHEGGAAGVAGARAAGGGEQQAAQVGGAHRNPRLGSRCRAGKARHC